MNSEFKIEEIDLKKLAKLDCNNTCVDCTSKLRDIMLYLLTQFVFFRVINNLL